jgi:D-lactate dehydrogenase (cytochrome)
MTSNITPNIQKELTLIVGKKYISFQETDKHMHAKDRSFHKAVTPQLVIWPKNTKEISRILSLANKQNIPVTAWGGGSSLEGNPIPTSGGIVLNMTRMDKVLNVLPQDFQARVQPGIIGEALDLVLSPHGLWFAAAPGSKHLATIGGMLANNSGGMHAIKYGVVAEAVLELEVVLANGDIIRLGSRSFKSSAGYNLKRLFIGSEGTLGIITEAVLKLTPLPKTKIAVLASFPTNSHAAKTSLELLRSDIKPAAIEFMDGKFIALANKGTGEKYSQQPTLLIELHGEKDTLLRELAKIKKLCLQNKATSYHEYTSKTKLVSLWQFRRAGRPTMAKLFPNTGVLSAEVGVPISKVPDLLQKAEELGKQYHVDTISFGHMGDGNFHGWALYELGNQMSWEKVVKLNEELILFALSVGGTTTGEHGLGIGKRKFLPIEHPTGMPLMKTIKQVFDPKGILNPGKIFPD